MSRIETLTPEQEALIPVIRDKWRRIVLSTEPIERKRAKKAAKTAYAAIDLKEPRVIFCDNPHAAYKAASAALEAFARKGKRLIGFWMWPQLESQIQKQIESHLRYQLKDQLRISPWRWADIIRCPRHPGVFDREYLTWINEYVSWFDFCISVLNCEYDSKMWEGLQSLVKNCGWIFPFDKVCIVSARPIQLSFDNQQRLHAEGQPAIQFADGYSLYFYHGRRLPEKYEKLHPREWKVQWILEEDNSEVRRILIQEIGYTRICQELQANELDYWQEYTLLKIDDIKDDVAELNEENEDEDVEQISIYLLKMTCPSTGFIHALRVPPDMKSAREAIRWVNWGIDPEEFGVQT